MMRPGLTLAFLLLVGAPALADPMFRVGGDVSAYLREEAGGNRAVLPSLGLRASYIPMPPLALTLQYGAATLGPSGGVASTWAWLHRVSLRGDGRLALGTHAVVLGAGPAVTMVATSLADRGTPVASTFVTRPGVEALVAFETRLGTQTWRASFQGLWTAGRIDFWTGLGVDFGLGEVR